MQCLCQEYALRKKWAAVLIGCMYVMGRHSAPADRIITAYDADAGRHAHRRPHQVRINKETLQGDATLVGESCCYLLCTLLLQGIDDAAGPCPVRFSPSALLQ